MVNSNNVPYEIEIGYEQEDYKKLEEKYVQSEKLLQRLLTDQEKQNNCVSRELYHSVAQTLYSILLGLKMTINSDVDDRLKLYLKKLEKSTDEALVKVKKISNDLYPQVIDDIGFVPALTGYVKMLMEDGIYVDLQINGEKELSNDNKNLLYFRVCQEIILFISNELKENSLKLMFISYNETEKKLIFLFNQSIKAFSKTTIEDGLAITLKRLLVFNGEIQVFSKKTKNYDWTVEVILPSN